MGTTSAVPRESSSAQDKRVRFGAVIFTGNVERLARFYQGVAALSNVTSDEGVTVLAAEGFELVVHALRGEPADPASAEREAYVKPFFIVASLEETRERAASLGGRLEPASTEWDARGFRACEAVDPDGNPIQFREVSSRR
jgi:predicted enzyme related to lactoylglutathione lyase